MGGIPESALICLKIVAVRGRRRGWRFPTIFANEQAQVLAGVIKARIESDLAFRIAGKMATRLVDTGATVHEGDALARLDDADFRLQLEEAEAEQSSAKAAFVQAEAEERRLTMLSKQGWTANADFDKAARPPTRREQRPCAPTARSRLRAWEQERSRPIGGVRAYLTMIDADAKGAARLLESTRKKRVA